MLPSSFWGHLFLLEMQCNLEDRELLFNSETELLKHLMTRPSSDLLHSTFCPHKKKLIPNQTTLSKLQPYCQPEPRQLKQQRTEAKLCFTSIVCEQSEIIYSIQREFCKRSFLDCREGYRSPGLSIKL